MTQEEKDLIVSQFNGVALNFVVILKEIPNENITEGKLDISLSVDKDNKYRKAIVVSIGVDCPKDFVSVGSEVIFDMYKASELTLNAVQYKTTMFADLTMVL